jgi:hypothetical protein
MIKTFKRYNYFSQMKKTFKKENQLTLKYFIKKSDYSDAFIKNPSVAPSILKLIDLIYSIQQEYIFNLIDSWIKYYVRRSFTLIKYVESEIGNF